MNIKRISDAYQEMLNDLMGDLETGSHHLNNHASQEFAKKYPWFHKGMHKLGEVIEAELNKETK